MIEKNFQKYLKVLSEELSILPDKEEETVDNTLRALWLSAAGVSVSAVKSESHQLPELKAGEYDVLERLVRKRLEGVPLAHITGKQSFLGAEFNAGPDALIPRKETELLVLTSINLLQGQKNKTFRVVDVCTGAGNVAISIANAIADSEIYASDISTGAIELAKQNAQLHDVSSRVSFYSGDLLEPINQLRLDGSVDLLCCNPPYISSSKVSGMPDEISNYEPDVAFDGGPFGINLIFRLITDAVKLLSNDGYLVLEVGLGQGNAIQNFIKKSGFYQHIRLINDDEGNPRVLHAQKI